MRNGALFAQPRLKEPSKEDSLMVQKIVTVALIAAAMATAACNTVRGAAKDVNSVANCTENTMHNGHC